MKRKLLLLLLVLLLISIAIGTSPIVDYFYSLADSPSDITTAADKTGSGTAADKTAAAGMQPDEVRPITVVFAATLATLTVAVALIYYLRKRNAP